MIRRPPISTQGRSSAASEVYKGQIEVRVDQDAIKSGAAAGGAPWRLYDLGHGYCAYDFFDQCPHRLACARCAFYRPKGSAQAQLLEGQANLLRMRQDLPLREEELAAVEEGIATLTLHRPERLNAWTPEMQVRCFDLLAECDAVIAAVPETPETTGLMDEAAFAAMPAGCFFCNVGRGSLVDEPALIAALERGHLRAAALDVASVEPLPPDHPLWDAPNLYLSPHSASSPAALFVNLHALIRENLARYLADEPLVNEVDVGRGY